MAVSTEKQGCSSLPASSRLCWPGHLGVWKIWRNTDRSHLAGLLDPWTAFGCCQPGMASQSCLSAASEFSLLNSSCGPVPPLLHMVCFCSDVESHIHSFTGHLGKPAPVPMWVWRWGRGEKQRRSGSSWSFKFGGQT